MTPIQIIVTIWMIGTGTAFHLTIITQDLDEEAKELEEKYSIFSLSFVKKLVYFFSLLYCFFMWWYEIPKAVFIWIRMRIVIFLVKKIVKLAGTGKTAKMEKLLKTVQKISGNEKDSDNI